MTCENYLEFKWDDVKNDKYRENYLGHSLNAPVGRWYKGTFKFIYHSSIVLINASVGKDLNWYAKGKKVQSDLLANEIAQAQQRDEDLMNEALYVASSRRI
jgi:hypothetical protein